MPSPERIPLITTKIDNLDSVDVIKHLARYRLATCFTSAAGVTLDCACGVGYGANILAQHSKRVIAVDRDAEAIQLAEKHYSKKNIEFELADIGSLRFSETFFDAIVSLETLEHIDYMTAKNFLLNCSRWLKPGGTFVGSSPMLRFRNGEPYVTNPYHINELPRTELLNLIHQSFPEEIFLVRTFWQAEDHFIPLDKECEGFCVFVATKKGSSHEKL